MLNGGSTSDSQTPRQEAWDRALEQMPALGIPRLVGIEHLRASLASARSRVNDSHRMQVRQLDKITGDAGAIEPEGEEMGGISVAGDTTINITTPAASSAVSGTMKKALPYLLTAAIAGGTGVGIPWLLGLFDRQPAAVQQPVIIPDWQLGLEVKDQP